MTISLYLSPKIQENLDLLHKIQVGGKHVYCTSKTGSRHTSQDMGADLMVLLGKIRLALGIPFLYFVGGVCTMFWNIITFKYDISLVPLL